MAKKWANRTFKEFLWEMLSEKDYISSKRVAGMIMILVALGITIYLAVKEGGSNTVEGLTQTAFIVGTSLLGLTSVTSIWKGGKVTTSSIPSNTIEEHEPEPTRENPDEENEETNKNEEL